MAIVEFENVTRLYRLQAQLWADQTRRCRVMALRTCTRITNRRQELAADMAGSLMAQSLYRNK